MNIARSSRSAAASTDLAAWRAERIASGPSAQQRDICFGAAAIDHRVPSADLRVGRLLRGTKRPEGASTEQGHCTAFIIDTPAGLDDKLHLTAGHCFDRDLDDEITDVWSQDMTDPFVLQIKVPASNANCTIIHPAPAWQFPVDPSSVISRCTSPQGNYY